MKKDSNEIMSISVVCSNYPAPGHAANVFVQQLVHAMIERGVEVTVIAHQSMVHALVHKEKLLPRRSKGKTESGVEYDILRPYTLSFGKNNPLKKLTQSFNKRAIRRQLAKIGSDVVYTHFWSSALLVYQYAAKKKLSLFVACGEGDNALEDMVAAMGDEDRMALREAVTGVVSVSSENKRKCVNYGLVADDDIEVFPNCVNTKVFHRKDTSEMKRRLAIGENDFVIAFVGNFNERKGPDRIAEAIKKLNDPQIKSIFIGKPFAGYAYDFDCPGIVHKGPVDHELLAEYVNCADIFVMPTRKEGCCNAIVEALAMGLPVVSSDGAFNDDILDPKNSIRIDPDNVDAIAAAIKRLKENPELCEAMRSYSLSRHEEYSIEKRAAKIMAFIKRQASKKA